MRRALTNEEVAEMTTEELHAYLCEGFGEMIAEETKTVEELGEGLFFLLARSPGLYVDCLKEVGKSSNRPYADKIIQNLLSRMAAAIPSSMISVGAQHIRHMKNHYGWKDQ